MQKIHTILQGSKYPQHYLGHRRIVLGDRLKIISLIPRLKNAPRYGTVVKIWEPRNEEEAASNTYYHFKTDDGEVFPLGNLLSCKAEWA